MLSRDLFFVPFNGRETEEIMKNPTKIYILPTVVGLEINVINLHAPSRQAAVAVYCVVYVYVWEFLQGDTQLQTVMTV